jgi:serine kinase of HPr protein (carbohydrate metabolism regulator)
VTRAPLHVHGTAIALAGHGILIRGRPRSGKSALAFMALRRAEAAGLTAGLVADDQVLIEPRPGGRLVMSAPAPIAGLLEISGVGILREARGPAEAGLDLLVDLSADPDAERLPDPATGRISGAAARRIVLPERQAALGAEILLHLARDGFAGFDARPGGP